MKSKKTIRTLTGADPVISYEVIQKDIKNMYLRLREDGTIVVTANHRIPLETVDRFVLKNIGFIAGRKEKLEQEALRAEEQAELQYVTGETVRIFGRPVPLVVREGRPASVQFDIPEGEEQSGVKKSFVIMTVPEGYDAERRKRLYLNDLEKYTKKCLLQMCTRVWPLFRPYGVAWPEVKFRTMKSRWGSCQPQGGKITLNLRLVEKPYAAAEYVVVHEFAHFLHADHSPRFYAAVEHFMPDYRERKKLLK